MLVTASDDLAEALAVAQQWWPEETSRARLLTQLTLLGSRTLSQRGPDVRAQRRRTFLERPREAYRGMFPPGDREALRDEWPS